MERAGFDEWYGREHGALISSLAVVAGDIQVATDSADEAFARAYERWAAVGQMDSPAGWTYRTALNVVRRRMRRAAIERALMEKFSVKDGSNAAPPDWSIEIWDALQRLAPRERTAIALRYVADLPTRGIAEAMGIAEGTVGSTLSAAREKLASVLDDNRATRGAAPAPTVSPRQEPTSA